MSFFSKILKFIFGENRVIENDFFGKMLDAGGYFECNRYFTPINKIIECGVSTDPDESFEKQIIFFRQVETNFEKIIEVLRPYLEKEVREWNPDYVFKDFSTDFEPTYLDIPNEEFENAEWNIIFVNNPICHFSHFEMKGLEFKSMNTDG